MASDSSLLYLPVAYMAAMVGFTGMRKIGLQGYLKPHQVTIAVAVGATVALYLGAYAGYVSLMPGRVRALALFAQSVFFAVALNQRNELPRGAMLLTIFFATVMCVMTAFNAAECDRWVNLVLTIESLLLLGSFLAIRSAEDSRKRENILHGIWAAFCFLAMWFCEEEQVLNTLYFLTGVGGLIVAKINHPVLGDTKVGDAVDDKDPEASSSWRM